MGASSADPGESRSRGEQSVDAMVYRGPLRETVWSAALYVILPAAVPWAFGARWLAVVIGLAFVPLAWRRVRASLRWDATHVVVTNLIRRYDVAWSEIEAFDRVPDMLGMLPAGSPLARWWVMGIRRSDERVAIRVLAVPLRPFRHDQRLDGFFDLAEAHNLEIAIGSRRDRKRQLPRDPNYQAPPSDGTF